MKKVIMNEELTSKIQEALTLLCEPVKLTLGPKGENVIIDHSNFTPFITNDGVTIAENITSEDPIIDTILTLAKEASIKTNETVGDGTTTTLVLLDSIFKEGQKAIESGYSPLILKQELMKETLLIIEKLKKESKKPTLNDLQNIAYIASGDNVVSSILKKAYHQVGPDNIYLEESLTEETTVYYNEGYSFETIIASPYFFSKEDSIILNNPYLYLTNNIINNKEELVDILDFIISNKASLIIIAKDYDEYFINEMLNYYLNDNLNIILLKTPGYGPTSLSILDDLNTISAPINSPLNQVLKAHITNDTTTFFFKKTPALKKYVQELKHKFSGIASLDFKKRLGMLQKGQITIHVGAQTPSERREKKMRYEDAIWALKSCNEGILPGSGLMLYKYSLTLTTTNKGSAILKTALTKPLEQILINASLDPNNIISYLKEQNFQVLYNVLNNSYENIKNTIVIDPTKVIINALKNAVSIASLLLTTKALVINELNPTPSIEEYP